MPKRRRAILLCGPARSALAAVARELAQAENLTLVIQAQPAELPAAQRLSRGIARRGAAVRVVGATLGGDAESRRLVDAAWAAARTIDAAVICATVPTGGDVADPTLDDWQAGIATGLRAPFFLAKHVARRLRRVRGARLVLAMDTAARGAGPVSAVTHQGFVAMVEALATALAPRVSVGAVVARANATRRPPPAQIARAVAFFVTGDPPPSGTVLELGAASRRG